MTNDEYELNREVSNLANDKRLSNIAIQSERNRYARLMKNGLGEDIDNVLSGKVVVKLTKKEKFKYKFKYYIDKIFGIF